jgi:tetratricopeptide (TPR) repeat protein
MATLQHIQKKIMNKSFTEASHDLQIHLQQTPDDPDAIYMMAVCHRYLRQFDDALNCLDQLQQITPENGRAFQEEGHVYRDNGQVDQALRAYSLASRFNPALLAAWREQVQLLAGSGRTNESNRIKSQLNRLSALPNILISTMDLIAQGKLLKAEEICRRFLQQVPDHVEAMRLLADIGMRLGVLDDAEFLLKSAIDFEPSNIQARIDYIQALRKRQKFTAALTAAESLLEIAPDNPQFQSLYAIENMQTGDYDTAITLFESVLQKIPNEPVTLTSRGHALKTIGRYEEAVASYQAAIQSAPTHGEAFYSLANLKTYRFAHSEIEQMQASLGKRGLSHMDRVHLNFALGKAYEDSAYFELSFNHYNEGNRLKKAQSRYSAEQMADEFQSQQEICQPVLMDRRIDTGFAAPDPIFILGLPRAGSTLLEQILSSHSQVDGTLELPNILSLTHHLRRGERMSAQPGYPEVLSTLDSQTLRKFGEDYIRDTAIHRQGAPFFIDKMPNNFRHIGLIKLILPNAKIIDARRHPMACCFSGFRQLFAEGQEFSYSLKDIGRYYHDYIALMSHWNDVLPDEILTVHHENVVDNLEAEVSRMLEFCGLPFEKACVEYHKTQRSVRTPNSEQVRQPIFREGLDAWHHYDAWLTPLKDALGEDIRREYDIV